MDSMEKEKVLERLHDVQKSYFSESESRWYKYLDQAVEELEYMKEEIK